MNTNFQIELERSIIDKIIGSDEALMIENENIPDFMIARFSNDFNNYYDLKDSVSRDIEWLLNTRQYSTAPKKSYEELQASLYEYGLKNLTSEGFSIEKLTNLLQDDIQKTLETFEPRLSDIKVDFVDPRKGTNKKESNTESNTEFLIRFSITAILKVQPKYKPVYFDTLFDIANKKYDVK